MQQEVSATVDRFTNEPLKLEPLGDKEPLAWNVFNTTNFELLLNSGSPGSRIRGDVLPSLKTPNYLEPIVATNLSLQTGQGDGIVHPMVGLALATSSRPMGDYLDWKALSEAYTDAYRLSFARAMVAVLGIEKTDTDFRSSKNATGQQQITSEAVVLEPVFVHIVVGFLGVVSFATIALLFLSLVRRRNLRTDPSTIASIMSMVADNPALLSSFAGLDCCSVEDVENILAQKRYKLVNNDAGTRYVEHWRRRLKIILTAFSSLLEVAYSEVVDFEDDIVDVVSPRRNSPTSIAKPVRPMEFSLWVASLFVSLFITLAVTLAIVFIKAHANGTS